MNSSFEQSFKKRLQNIAKERNQTPSEVWNNVISERFLVRLCNSSHRPHFILKGGWLLAKHVKLGRETLDLDFSIQRLSNEIGVLQSVINEIIDVEINDGFIFANPKIEPLEHFHMQYPGAQVKIDVQFGKAKFPLFVDLGFGDTVKTKEQKILLLANARGPLFEEHITLRCYPLEFVLAEKLETVIFRGSENSRMKDFHDLLTIVKTEGACQKDELKSAIKAVFEHRKTLINLPIRFNKDELDKLQFYWTPYRVTINNHGLPANIEEIISLINEYLTSSFLTF